MRGQLKLVIDRAFAEIWQPLTDHDDCPVNLFGEIYSGLKPFLREPEARFVQDGNGNIRNEVVSLYDRTILAMSKPEAAEGLLANLSELDFISEHEARRATGSIYSILCEVGTDDLANDYLDLLRTFIERYSLRYYVDEEAVLWLSFSGLVAALFAQIRLSVENSHHAQEQLSAFEHALAECLDKPTQARIATTIQKQVNFLEAIGSQHPHVSSNTLGQMFNEVRSWSHVSLQEAARQLYRFANDYPGIRHGGSEESAARGLDLRDAAGVTLSLVGLVVYLADDFETRLDAAMHGDPAPIGANSGATAPWLNSLGSGASTT